MMPLFFDNNQKTENYFHYGKLEIENKNFGFYYDLFGNNHLFQILGKLTVLPSILNAW
jgi:hypothetical protein